MPRLPGGDRGGRALIGPELIGTPAGPARVTLHRASKPAAVVVVGHGAGGGIDAPDLVALRAALLGAGMAVALVEQPYRVAGRRAPAPGARLDAAWLAAVFAVRGMLPSGRPLIVAGRSSGARVACRTAAATGAAGMLALAFPLYPPGRPERSRAAELAGAGVPAVVVQGSRDPFGTPGEIRAAVPGVEVLAVAGADHSLRRLPADVLAAVVGQVSRWGRAPRR